MCDTPAFKDLEDAHRDEYAIAAISVYGIDGAIAVEAAAADEGMPVILQTGSSGFAYSGEETLTGVALTISRTSSARVHVHLDHSRDLDELQRCLDAGYSSVMFDGSHLSLDENIALTRRVVKLAHEAGAWVEGEVGSLGGQEDPSSASVQEMLTDPSDADRFVAETRVDALAVSIGNVHGIPPNPVKLDLDRLALIRSRIDIPLVLHGASGLSTSDVATAIDLGVAKINVNADTRSAFLGALRKSLRKSDDDLVRHMEEGRRAMQLVAQEKIRLFGRRHHDLEGSRRP